MKISISEEERKSMRDMLNKAFEVIDHEEGATLEVDIKNEDAIVEVISAVQGVYGLGMDFKEGKLFYELNEKIKEKNDGRKILTGKIENDS